MALIALHSEGFIPSLSEIHSFFSAPRVCCWHQSGRRGGQLVRCSKRISEADADAAGAIINNLQDVQSQSTSETHEEYIYNLQQLAPLLLCRGTHRSVYAKTISQYWDSELDGNLLPGEPPRLDYTQRNTTEVNSNPVPTSKLDRLIENGSSPSQKSVRMPKGTRLEAHTGSTSSSDGTRIATIMGELARCLYSSKTGLKLLGDLGELIGCPEDQFLTESMGPDFPGILEASPDLKEAQNPIPPVTPVKQEGNRRRGHSPTTPGSKAAQEVQLSRSCGALLRDRAVQYPIFRRQILQHQREGRFL